jgi:putative sigma-54 modulation protein
MGDFEVVITGHNMKVPSRLREYVERKVDRLDRYMPNIDEVRIDLAEERMGNRRVAQITVRNERGIILRAEESTNDIFAAVDSVVDKIYRQIERYKGKRRRRGESADELDAVETAVELEEAELATGELVRRKRFLVMPMTEGEAIEQMELLGHDFFLFYNAEMASINVVYRRKDGNYGLIEPELG